MTLSNDPRTDAERRYDAERDGSLYAKPAQQPGDLMIACLEFVDELEREAERITTERHDDYESPCMDYICGDVTLEVLDEPDERWGVVSVVNFGGDYITLDKALADARALLTLLNDPRVTAVLAARGVEAPRC